MDEKYEAVRDCPVFQSAPLTEARGDETAPDVPTAPDTFQSAPLTEARGDKRLRTVEATNYRFNPLPLPKQGEISILRRQQPITVVSIRSPYRSKGR